MAGVLAAVAICVLLNGCSQIPIREGGLALDKNTVAGIDDIGVGRVTRQF